jgi:hypothetical protein
MRDLQVRQQFARGSEEEVLMGFKSASWATRGKWQMAIC